MMVKYSVKEIQAYDKALSIAQEVIENIRTVTSFHGQKKEEERFISLINSTIDLCIVIDLDTVIIFNQQK